MADRQDPPVSGCESLARSGALPTKQAGAAPDTASVETAKYQLPLQDGIPVLSPLQKHIERGETLRTLREQVDCECEASPGLRRALNSMDRLILEQIEDMALDELLDE